MKLVFNYKIFFTDILDVEWASYNIGIFLCTRCAGVHRAMGAHISKVKHLKLDKWEDSQLERMKEVGNLKARLRYEPRVPLCYRRPCEDDSQWVQLISSKCNIVKHVQFECDKPLTTNEKEVRGRLDKWHDVFINMVKIIIKIISAVFSFNLY